MKKGKPIPIRFNADEELLLTDLAERTGLNKSELIRRTVRLLGREVNIRQDVRFILELISVNFHPHRRNPDTPNYLNEMPQQRRPYDARPMKD